MGDFNRDLLQVNTKKTWLEYMESFGLEQIVMSPTRITDHSETLIDHIYCNNLSNVLSTKVPILKPADLDLHCNFEKLVGTVHLLI